MQNQVSSNVVTLEKNSSSRPVKESDSKLLAGCRQLILERLGRAIPGMMDQVDDSLFELAEKADTNRTQAIISRPCGRCVSNAPQWKTSTGKS